MLRSCRYKNHQHAIQPHNAELDDLNYTINKDITGKKNFVAQNLTQNKSAINSKENKQTKKKIQRKSTAPIWSLFRLTVRPSTQQKRVNNSCSNSHSVHGTTHRAGNTQTEPASPPGSWQLPVRLSAGQHRRCCIEILVIIIYIMANSLFIKMFFLDFETSNSSSQILENKSHWTVCHVETPWGSLL